MTKLDKALALVEPFWSDLTISHRDMDRRTALECHAALVEAIPRKVALLKSVLEINAVPLTGRRTEDFSSAMIWLCSHARWRRMSSDEESSACRDAGRGI
jgi:hypothetical protein